MSTSPSPISILKISSDSINTSINSSTSSNESNTDKYKITNQNHNIKKKPHLTSLLGTLIKMVGLYVLFIYLSSKYNEHFTKYKINNNNNNININNNEIESLAILKHDISPSFSSSKQISEEEANLLTIKNKEELIKNNEKVKAMLSMLNINVPTESFSMPIFPTHNDNGYEYGSHKCIFRPSSMVDLFVYLNEQEEFDITRDSSTLQWFLPNIKFDWSFNQNFTSSINIEITPNLLNNGSYYAHTFFRRHKKDTNNVDVLLPQYLDETSFENPLDLAYKRISLITYKIKRKIQLKKKLLDINDKYNDNNENISSNIEPIISYWKNTLDISLVMDFPEYFQRNNMQASLARELDFHTDGSFYPVIYHNDFWLLSHRLIEVNNTITELPLSFSYSHISFWKWQLQNQMTNQWSSQQSMGLGSSDKETDTLKEMLIDTNPYLLGLTMAVSIFHTLFDILAFKNDIQFWKKKKNMQGMSLLTLVTTCFFQTIILLYLLDNDTSYVILFSSATGLAIEYWKLTKVFTISTNYNINSMIPKFSIKIADSYAGKITQKHDNIATTHLFYILLPIIFGYSAYSLIYNSHKSFYSWILNSLVGFVYSFGFIMMTPQLYINYKLKSVAHMPWKAMIYKSLNTFIDDLFAFVIKMPLLHRLSCFRDDIIFFIYLYQKWAYKVDYTRTNEFGQGGDNNGDDDNNNNLIKND